MTDLADFLARLQAEESEEGRLWLTLEFSLSGLPEAVREAVWAAAVPHWFDEPFLAALLGEEGMARLAAAGGIALLQAQSFVEVFPGRGHNVHERSRATLLDRLWQTDPERFRDLSRRAAGYCDRQTDDDAAWTIERIYHLLVANPDEGADQLSAAGWTWQNSPNFALNKVEALARAAREHVDTGRVTGYTAIGDRLGEAKTLRALGDVDYLLNHYVAARARYEEAQSIYVAIGDKLGEANTIKALGDVHLRQSDYATARARYEEARPIYASIGARLEEANTIKALGDVYFQQPDRDTAQDRYEESAWGDNATVQLPSDYDTAQDTYEESAWGDNATVQLPSDYDTAQDTYEGSAWRDDDSEQLPSNDNTAQDTYEEPAQRDDDTGRSPSNYDMARAMYEEARLIYAAIGDKLEEANTIKALGDMHLQQSNYVAAQAMYEEARPIYADIGHRLGEANTSQSLGDMHWRLFDYPAARVWYEEARLIYAAIGDRAGLSNILFRLGQIAWREGDLIGAEPLLAGAVELHNQFAPNAPETNYLTDQLDALLTEIKEAQNAQ